MNRNKWLLVIVFVIFSPLIVDFYGAKYNDLLWPIIIMFIMTLEFELFMYLSIWNAKRDTAKLLKDSK